MRRLRIWPAALVMLLACSAAARADDAVTVNDAGIIDLLESYAAQARATQPAWSSPLVTTSALLEDRVRFDMSFQQSGNGTSTSVYGGGKGIDLIVGPTEEVQIADAPYNVRTGPSGTGALQGFGDLPLLRFKQRLASGPDYVLSAWLQAQFPTGSRPLSNGVVTLLPTLGFGKSVGPVIVQGTIGASLPTSRESEVGSQLIGNLALQLHVLHILWPQIEANWTYFPNGPRGGLNQVFLTPGIIIGRFVLLEHLQATVGVGYQTAVSPIYRASPLTPAYDHAWLISTRVSF